MRIKLSAFLAQKYWLHNAVISGHRFRPLYVPLPASIDRRLRSRLREPAPPTGPAC